MRHHAPDSAHLQEQDVEYVNKKRARRGRTPSSRSTCRRTSTADDGALRARAYDDAQGNRPGRHPHLPRRGPHPGLRHRQPGRARERRRAAAPLHRRPGPPPHAHPARPRSCVHDVDVLITESTYGNRLHPPREDVKAELAAPGQRDRPRTPAGSSSPPSASAARSRSSTSSTNSTTEGGSPTCPSTWTARSRRRPRRSTSGTPSATTADTLSCCARCEDAFAFPRPDLRDGRRGVEGAQPHAGPMIIISASGMCEGGRILHHLKHSIGDERNIILFVGYQAENTLGRRIVEARSPMQDLRRGVPAARRVEHPRPQRPRRPQRAARTISPPWGRRCERAFVVHGEPEAGEQLAADLRSMGAETWWCPEEGKTYKSYE